MKNIVIVGGGFAGVWAAQTAAHEVIVNDADIQVTVVSQSPFLNVRPRLYESNPNALRTPLAPALEPLDIDFAEGTVTSFDAANQTIAIKQSDGSLAIRRYDRLILALGSKLKDLPVSGLSENAWNIDTYDAAMALDQHLRSVLKDPEAPGNNTFVIVGAGFTGIELVTEMRNRISVHSSAAVAEKARIVLVERATVVGPDLGANPRPAVEAALRDANIEVKLAASVDAVTANSITLSSGERIVTKTVVTTAGLQANAVSGNLEVERDELGRIATTESLGVKGIPNVFAAGDVARAYVDDEHVALMSCQHAMEMGKYAGNNAAHDLLGLPLRPYRQPVYLTCLDLGQSGAVFTSGWDRQIQVSGNDAKNLKRQINTEWIYPPVGTRSEILAASNIAATADDTQELPKAVNE